MAQFESVKQQFDSRNAKVVFIAAEKRRGVFNPEQFFAKHPSSFPFLLDEDRAVTKAYGVYHRIAIDAINIAHPATFVVGKSGAIQFMYVGQSQVDRAPLEQVFAALDETK